jgi:hypothetical protein
MVGFIKMLSGQFVIVDAEKIKHLNQWNWSIGSNGYPKRQFRLNGKNKTVYLHREVLKSSHHIDHVSGDKTDARSCNLRECDPCKNLQNRDKQINNTSGFKGVHFLKRTGRYQAQIRANHKRWHIGYFSTAEEAAHAYDDKAREVHGEFARLNFP